MNILVLGSGLLGVSTTYELARRGFSVTALDRQKGCGAETSFANGGQLSYTHAEPWATPAILPKLPGWIVRPDAPLVMHPRLDWPMVKWITEFLRNCTPARAERHCADILRLGLYSKAKMAEIRAETGIEFRFRESGILHVFSKEEDYAHAKTQNAFQDKLGGGKRIVSRDECFAMEPALVHAERDIIGGMHAYQDEIGDCYTYCEELARISSERHRADFRCGVTVKKLIVENGRIAGVATDQGDFTADAYVMALGSYSTPLLRSVGIDIPVYPMKGYSITLPANEFCPQASVTDGTYKVVYTRLGDKLRVAGTAELAGYDDRVNEKRIAPIVQATKKMFPKADWSRPLEKWACLRPQTPHGLPIMGGTPYRNLFLNTGHGTLGWTQAAGAAAIVADIVENKEPEITLQGIKWGVGS